MSDAPYRPGWRRAEHEFEKEFAVSCGACPRVIAGMDCLSPRHDCVCRHYHGMLDYRKLWRTETGELVLTSVSYELFDFEVIAYLEDCRRLGLKVKISGESPYNPTRTFLIETRGSQALQKW